MDEITVKLESLGERSDSQKFKMEASRALKEKQKEDLAKKADAVPIPLDYQVSTFFLEADKIKGLSAGVACLKNAYSAAIRRYQNSQALQAVAWEEIEGLWEHLRCTQVGAMVRAQRTNQAAHFSGQGQEQGQGQDQGQGQGQGR